MLATSLATQEVGAPFRGRRGPRMSLILTSLSFGHPRSCVAAAAAAAAARNSQPGLQQSLQGLIAQFLIVIMVVLTLHQSVCSTGGAIYLNPSIPQRQKKYECILAVNNNFRKLGLPREENFVKPKQKRTHVQTRILAIAQPQTVVNDEGNDAGHQNAVLEISPPEADEHSATKDAEFNWNKAWYPIAVTADLETDAPTGVTIIGRPLAVWWDRAAGKWQVYADQCPHRLAPLSEGSISEDGHLRCSYHGWTFQGDSGKCTHIPQAPPDGKVFHASKRACVTVYPSMEQQGILWFWPDLSQGTVNVEAAANPPPVFPELSDPTFKYVLSSRDLEYGYEVLIENLMDPSHVNFAHHKIQGNRKNGGPLNFKVKNLTTSGYEGEGDRGPSTFVAPCSFTMRNSFPSSPNGNGPLSFFRKLSTMLLTIIGQGKMEPTTDNTLNKVTLLFLCIPVSPGRSRVIWSFPRNFATSLTSFIPRWYQHITNNLVLDSDMYLLHLLEKRLEHEGAGNWLKVCYVPTTADTYVISFRRWLRDFAGGAPDWAGRFDKWSPPSPPRRIIMDRYYSHVQKCKACRGALKNFRGLEIGLQALAIALVGVVGTSAALPIQKLRSLSVPLVAGAVLSTLLSRLVAHFIHKTFYFHDYNHAAVK